jgi:malonate-semialdehyde dehydrogenase (acetylating) / methylmalonate-semialdehyde dehydrogenase
VPLVNVAWLFRLSSLLVSHATGTHYCFAGPSTSLQATDSIRLIFSCRIPDLVARAKKLVVNAGHEPGTDVGPVVSKKAKARIEGLIQSGIDQGAKLELDGRGVKVDKYPNGNFIGPTILSGVTPEMECYKYVQRVAARQG